MPESAFRWLETIAQRTEEREEIVDLTFGQCGASVGRTIERCPVPKDVVDIGGRQIIGYARGSISPLRVAVAGGVEANNIAQFGKESVVHECPALGP